VKHRAVIIAVVLLASSSTARAQNPPTSWGVVGTFVPEWHIPPPLETIAALHFSEDDIAIDKQNLQGIEFRLGVARGRARSGDWGVSFLRRTFDDVATAGISGGGCIGNLAALQCEDFGTELTRRNVLLSGVEAYKFMPFVTIAERVQVGLNVAGGFGFMSGNVDTKTTNTKYTCAFPPGVFPEPEGSDEPFAACKGGTISNVRTIETGRSTADVSRILKSDSKMLPIGKVELGAAVIAGPRVKVRVAGGFSYPGVNAVSISGVYFFRD
jgi:hypothetical protein